MILTFTEFEKIMKDQKHIIYDVNGNRTEEEWDNLSDDYRELTRWNYFNNASYKQWKQT